jgi:hypothetical protein
MATTGGFVRTDLEALPRRDLQALAKAQNIKANGTSSSIVDALLLLVRRVDDKENASASSNYATPKSSGPSPARHHAFATPAEAFYSPASAGAAAVGMMRIAAGWLRSIVVLLPTPLHVPAPDTLLPGAASPPPPSRRAGAVDVCIPQRAV